MKFDRLVFDQNVISQGRVARPCRFSKNLAAPQIRTEFACCSVPPFIQSEGRLSTDDVIFVRKSNFFLQSDRRIATDDVIYDRQQLGRTLLTKRERDNFIIDRYATKFHQSGRLRDNNDNNNNNNNNNNNSKRPRRPIESAQKCQRKRKKERNGMSEMRRKMSTKRGETIEKKGKQTQKNLRPFPFHFHGRHWRARGQTKENPVKPSKTRYNPVQPGTTT